ncbi:MAG: NADH-quinone oxidoreductase subunit N [Nitrospirae bacterium]|nr:NADH-quinone oxidoreductase subunit N [Nitrospirota bacterium]
MIEVPLPDLNAILPEIILVVFGLSILMIDLFLPKERKNLLALFSIAGVALAALATFNLLGQEITTFSGMFVSDDYASFFKFLFYAATILTILISVQYLRFEDLHVGEYYSIMLFAVTGMMVMASASDLVTVYLGLELMAISVYIMVGLTRSSLKSNEASLKYFILGAFASGILLYGISLIYGITGSTNLKVIGTQLAGTDLSNPGLVLSMLMIAVGFAFKIAAVPFHMWTPDAYEGAPTPVTAFMSVGPKAAAFAAFIRVFIDAFPGIRPDWSMLLATLAVLTMVVGNVLALSQTNIKRMLAYSSIAHAGYALIGVVAGGALGLGSVLLYLMIYLFMNMGAFGIIILLSRGQGVGDNIRDYTGLAKKNPLAAFLMLVFMFSLTGIPPTAGFIGKFYLFMAAVQNGYTFLAIVGLIMSAVSAVYYLQVVMVMYMREPEQEFSLATSPALPIALTVSVIAVLFLGIFPAPLVDYALSVVLPTP